MRTDLLELLARRAPYIERLADGPVETRTLADDLPHSRTTVNRALRELQDAGLAERTGDGYATTPAGDLAWRSLHRHEQAAAAAVDAAEMLAPLASGAELPPGAVADGTARLAGPDVYDRLAADLDPPVGGWLSAPDADLLSTVAAGDGSATLVVAPGALEDLLAAAPSVLRTVAARSGTTVLVGETPPYSLVLDGSAAVEGADDDAETTGSATVAVHDGDDVHATIRLADPAWAVDRFASLRQAATAVGGVLAGHDDADPDAVRVHLRDAAPAAFESDPPLPAALARQGFRRLTDAYFERDPAPPAAALRSGLTPLEVAHGYAIDRFPDGDVADGDAGAEADATPLAEQVVDRLAAGDPVALVGPPGSGKSTTGMRAAVAWHRAGRGPVVYRSGDAGSAVESPALLSAYLRAVDGHALLVVEDAPRPEVAPVFGAVADVADRADVAVLVDAREGEWRDRTPIEGADAATVVSMPSATRTTAERLLERTESLTGTAVDADPGALLDSVGAGDAVDDAPTPGQMYLLNHWLSLHEADVGVAATPESALTADVEAVLDDVTTDGPPLATDVAILSNLLNLAGLGVRRELVYAVADARHGAAGEGGTVAETDGGGAVAGADGAAVPVEAAEDALGALSGRCVFDWSRGRDPARFRTPHETWSTAFLAAFLDREGTARERFGAVVTAVLSLADDADRRRRVAAALDGRGPNLSRLATDPGGWADDVVEAVFEVPTSRGQLAPLYGHADESPIDLPAACSSDVELAVAARRGEAYGQRGDVAGARREFEWILDNADRPGVDRETAEDLRAEAERRLAAQARDRGDLDRAAELLDRSRRRYRDLGDDAGRGKVERNVGIVNAMRGDLDEAETHLAAAIEAHRAADNRTGLANAYNDRGLLAKKRGDLEVAADALSAARDLLSELGDVRRESVATMNLGTVAVEQNDFREGRRLLSRALGLAREAGYERGVVSTLTNLGSAALQQLELDDAEAYVRQAGVEARRLDDAGNRMAALRNLGEVARLRGRHEAAAVYFEAAADALDDSGNSSGLRLMRARLARDRGECDRAAATFEELLDDYPGQAARELAECARLTGDLDAAEARIERAVSYYRDNPDPDEHALSLAVRARIEMDRGDPAAAATALDAAGEYCDPADPTRRADLAVAVARGRLRRRRGDATGAVEALRPAAARARSVGAVPWVLRAADPLVDALAAIDRTDDAIEWCNAAAGMAADAGLDEEAGRFLNRADRLVE